MRCTNFPGLIEALCERGKDMSSGYVAVDFLEDEEAFPELMQNAVIVGAEMALERVKPLLTEVRKLLQQVKSEADAGGVTQLSLSSIEHLRSLLPDEK